MQTTVLIFLLVLFNFSTYLNSFLWVSFFCDQLILFNHDFFSYASTHMILTDVDSIEIKQSLGRKQHMQENPKIGLLLRLLRIHPITHNSFTHPQEKQVLLSEMHTKAVKIHCFLDVANLWSIVQKNPYVGSSAFPNSSTKIVGPPSTVPIFLVTTPLIVLTSSPQQVEPHNVHTH